MAISPPPIRTDFLERGPDRKLTGKVSWWWIKWLMELAGVAPEDPNALLSLTIQESEPIGNIEDIADQAALSSALETSAFRESEIEELSSRIALSLNDPIPAPVIPAYGGMYSYSLGGSGVTVGVASADVFYLVDTGMSAMALALMEFQNSRELRVLYPGHYSVDWHMSLECASANQELEGSLMISGSEQTESSAHIETVTANKPQSLGGTWGGYLGQDDLVQLSVLNHTAANDIIVDHVSLWIERISD